jgi:hypothetical protein
MYVNRLRYYTTQVGLQRIDVCCSIDSFPKDGHVAHLASLSLDDILWTDPDLLSATISRLWQASDEDMGPNPPNGMNTSLDISFNGGRGTRYFLVFYEAKK